MAEQVRRLYEDAEARTEDKLELLLQAVHALEARIDRGGVYRA